MKALSIWEFGAQLNQLENLLKLMGEITITQHGKPIARLSPVSKNLPKPSHADLRAKMPPLLTPSEILLREDREGR